MAQNDRFRIADPTTVQDKQWRSCLSEKRIIQEKLWSRVGKLHRVTPQTWQSAPCRKPNCRDNQINRTGSGCFVNKNWQAAFREQSQETLLEHPMRGCFLVLGFPVWDKTSEAQLWALSLWMSQSALFQPRNSSPPQRGTLREPKGLEHERDPTKYGAEFTPQPMLKTSALHKIMVII